MFELNVIFFFVPKEQIKENLIIRVIIEQSNLLVIEQQGFTYQIVSKENLRVFCIFQGGYHFK